VYEAEGDVSLLIRAKQKKITLKTGLVKVHAYASLSSMLVAMLDS
jgi:hypothetical protein